MFGIRRCFGRLLQTGVGVLLCATTSIAQTDVSASQPPPTRVVPSGARPETSHSWTLVTPQYNFSYGADPSQPQLPYQGSWNFWTPDQPIGPSTPGWTTGTFGLQGLNDADYYQPGFKLGDSRAGGCLWNNSYDTPPLLGTYWYYAPSGTYELFPSTSPIIRAGPAIGSIYQAGSQQVAGSGVPMYGFMADASWDSHTYPGQQPQYVGAIYSASNSCTAGSTEYGFNHLNYYSPPIEQFYFSLYTNCTKPSGSAGHQSGFACDWTNSQPINMSAPLKHCA